MIKNCKTCKNYNPDKEFNCTHYNIVIPNLRVAKKCDFYITTLKRKRCNRCEHLTYGYKQNKRKYVYMCEITKQMRSYTALVHCGKFKKKNDEI